MLSLTHLLFLFLFPGLKGDDFLVLGLQNGTVVYSFNLGSGTTTIVSEPLDRLLEMHVVRLGRFLRTGWLKVGKGWWTGEGNNLIGILKYFLSEPIQFEEEGSESIQLGEVSNSKKSGMITNVGL